METKVPTKILKSYLLTRTLFRTSQYGVFLARNIVSNAAVIVKMAPSGKLNKEYQIQMLIHRDHSQRRGLQRLITFEQYAGKDIMVFEMLGQQLCHLRKICGGLFSVDTVLRIGIQAFHLLDVVHKCGIVHGNVTPHHLCIGHFRAEKKVIFLTGFEGATKWMNFDGNSHIKADETRTFRGNECFASLTALSGHSLSPRDDIEALVYSLIYMARSLPWLREISEDEANRSKRIKEMRDKTSISDLCSHLPKAFKDLIIYARGMRFEEVPDIHWITNLLRDALMQRPSTSTRRRDGVFEPKYDWELEDVEGEDSYRRRCPYVSCNK